MTHGVHATVQPVELCSPNPPVDPTVRNAQIAQLAACHDAVLAKRQLRNDSIDSRFVDSSSARRQSAVGIV
jgi:hypothetical protein